MVIKLFRSLALAVILYAHTATAEFTFDVVQNVDFAADFYVPKKTGQYGVLVLGGSEGGKPMALAKKIAAMGYPVLALAYFKEKKLPEALEMIPLEYFEAPKQWLMNHQATRNDGIVVVGWSKGAELSVLLASRDNDYKAVVGIAPSSVVWAGILNDSTKAPSSSWSFNKEPLPFVPFAQGINVKQPLELSEASMSNKESVKKATIQAQSILVDTLLLTGGRDSIWPANKMAESLCQRINAFKRYNPCKHINYPEAGHLLNEKMGGTFENNAVANKQSIEEIANMLKKVNQ